LAGWGFAQYPYLVIPDLTLTTAATVRSTPQLLAWALAAGALLLLPSFAYLFYVFKRRPDGHDGVVHP
jgi:cytochrome d ubiquinol oxidase subunit II